MDFFKRRLGGPGLLYQLAGKIYVIFVDEMFLDPKVIITGWQKYYFLFVIVDPVSKSVHCMVEELSFVQSDDGVPEHLDRNAPNPELSAQPSPAAASRHGSCLLASRGDPQRSALSPSPSAVSAAKYSFEVKQIFFQIK